MKHVKSTDQSRFPLREGACQIPKKQVAELHTCNRSPVLKMVGDSLGFAAGGGLAVLAWYSGYYLLAIPALLLAGHFGHIVPLMFHDASHATLHPVRWKNEALGIMCGAIILVPLSAYRFAHAQHHRCPGTEQDPELWPFTVPGTPRWMRILCAMIEVVFGCLYTPFLFLRALCVAEKIPTARKRRIAIEYTVTLLYWGQTIALVAYFELWTVFLLGVIAPIMVAGAFQSLNKYVEHMGMTGAGALGMTRSVADERTLGQMLSASWQHVDHHGAHHLYARIPHYNLPETTPLIMSEEAAAETLYPTFWSAFVAMVKTLGNPIVGAQWVNAPQPETVTTPWDSRGATEYERHDSRDVYSCEQLGNRRA